MKGYYSNQIAGRSNFLCSIYFSEFAKAYYWKVVYKCKFSYYVRTHDRVNITYLHCSCLELPRLGDAKKVKFQTLYRMCE